MNFSWTAIWEEIDKFWCYIRLSNVYIKNPIKHRLWSLFAVEYFAKTSTIDVWQDYKYFAVYLHKNLRVYTLMSKKELNFYHKGNMEVRQIFLKRFCQRCAKAKKIMNVISDDWDGIIFKMPERASAGNN